MELSQKEHNLIRDYILLPVAISKVLRIIGNNVSGNCGAPSIRTLEIKTGRRREGVFKVLAVLAREGYIEWSSDDPERIVLMEAWERSSGINSVATRSAYGER